MEPFLGQITMFAGTFAPRGWAFCNGQLLAISSNTALFSIIGTTYGGDGRTTFALPDLRGRSPVNSGGNSAGPGLTPRQLGSRSGTETTTLIESNLPSHSHTAQINAVQEDATDSDPTGAFLAAEDVYSPGPSDIAMNGGAVSVGNTGGNIPFNNMHPYLAINFIIALQGIFPSRN